MQRWAVLLYGSTTYLVFLASLVYAVSFVGGFGVPQSIDTDPAANAATAIAIDLALLSLFAVQHSVMARPFFKRWWTRIIPPSIERSTYVLASSLLLLLVFWGWHPLPTIVWQVPSPWAVALWMLSGIGWVIVLVSTFLVDHFDLFGLRQVWLYFSAREYTPLPFQTPVLYRLVRHPIMLGFLVAFWANSTMTVGHLLFAVVVTAYVLIALRWEECDLRARYGEAYVAYQRRVRMLLPLPRFGSRQDE